MDIRAAVVDEEGADFRVADVTLDAPRDDEVLVRMVASGVCHTDAIVRDQWYPTPLPAVLGHEGAGVVEDVGSGVTTVEPGDQVVLSFNHCGVCRNCRRGEPAYCAVLFERNFGGRRPDGSTSLHDGETDLSSWFFGQSSFATYSCAAERSVVKVDADAPLELLGPLGCGIQTGAGTVLNALQPVEGSTIAIFGAGAVGDTALLAAVVANCSRIIMVDLHESRLETARELGATDTVVAGDGDEAEQIRELTGGAGVHYAADTTGVPAVFRQMVDSLGSRGVGALVGAARPGDESSIDVGSGLLMGYTLKMVIEGDAVPQLFIPKLVRLHAEGRFPFDRLTRRYGFDDINTAFADSADGSTLKPVLTF